MPRPLPINIHVEREVAVRRIESDYVMHRMDTGSSNQVPTSTQLSAFRIEMSEIEGECVIEGANAFLVEISKIEGEDVIM